MRRILLLNARRRVFLIKEIRKYIKNEHEDLEIAGADTDNLDPIAFFCDIFRIIPPIYSTEFKSELLKYVEEENIIGIVLWNDIDFKYIDEIREELYEKGANIICPNKKQIKLCNDKRETYYFAKKNNILVPKNYQTINDIIQYPIIIKPAFGAGSVNVYCAKNENQTKILSNHVKEPVFQEFIDGTHYTVDIFSDESGNPFCAVPRQRIKVHCSEVLIAKISMEKKIIQHALTIAKIIKIAGPINIQFIVDKYEKIYLLEINCRIGGGTDLTIQAGAPIGKWIVQMLLKKKLEKNYSICNKLYMSRYYSEVFFQC